MLELADIFRQHGAQYRAKYGQRMLPSHHQAMQAIEHCRTEVMGGHLYACEACGEHQYRYHSCQNRHCPKCQNEAAQQWLSQQQHWLLPVPYFLVTFTLPAALRPLARRNQKTIYNLLFRTAAAALKELALDPRFVGGQIGMLGILHTWGRDLSYHPHVHFVVPGGGLAADGQTWLPAPKKFLVHVKPLAKLYRAKFRDALKKKSLFDPVPAQIWTQPWIVHAKPVGSGQATLKYLAPYIFRVALSNNRLLKLEDGQVTFRYQASDTGETKLCTLSAEAFIHRFLQHVLPKGFVKVRYFGFLAPGKRTQLNRIWHLLALAPPTQPALVPLTEPCSPQHPPACPVCGQLMRHQQVIRPEPRRPP